MFREHHSLQITKAIFCCLLMYVPNMQKKNRYTISVTVYGINLKIAFTIITMPLFRNLTSGKYAEYGNATYFGCR